VNFPRNTLSSSIRNQLPRVTTDYFIPVMGKLEEQHPSMRHSEHYTPWHGHITVLTVAPAWRRLGHARRLTERLEQGSDINNAWFVDLYVRAGNKIAVDMYKGMGCVIFFYLPITFLRLLPASDGANGVINVPGTRSFGESSITTAMTRRECRNLERMRLICASRAVGIRSWSI
jgi:GNAT superfamily N-acetyltransferase